VSAVKSIVYFSDGPTERGDNRLSSETATTRRLVSERRTLTGRM